MINPHILTPVKPVFGKVAVTTPTVYYNHIPSKASKLKKWLCRVAWRVLDSLGGINWHLEEEELVDWVEYPPNNIVSTVLEAVEDQHYYRGYDSEFILFAGEDVRYAIRAEMINHGSAYDPHTVPQTFCGYPIVFIPNTEGLAVINQSTAKAIAACIK